MFTVGESIKFNGLDIKVPDPAEWYELPYDIYIQKVSKRGFKLQTLVCSNEVKQYALMILKTIGIEQMIDYLRGEMNLATCDIYLQYRFDYEDHRKV